MVRIVVTGATGFVGRRVVAALVAGSHDVVAALRGVNPPLPQTVKAVSVGDIGPLTDWQPVLSGADTVVHLAAQVPAHGVSDARFFAVNDNGTQRLVSEARLAGVTTFILVSTLLAASARDDAYTASKRRAEAHVEAFRGNNRIGISLRPPVVYGEEAKGNWPLLERLAASPVPLPFASVVNRRSLIAVENLADAIAAVLRVPSALRNAGTFAVADGPPVSLATIIRGLRAGMGRPAGLFAVPPAILRRLAATVGMASAADSLFGDLVADDTAFRAAYLWTPIFGTKEGLRHAGARLRARKASS